MTRPRRPLAVEIEDLDHLDELIAGGGSMRGWRLQGLDLTGREDALGRLDPAGSVVLGGLVPASLEASLRDRGGLVFPVVPDLPFDAYRGALYTPAELYEGIEEGYERTLDARVYAWSRRSGTPDVADTLARSLHDHAVGDALEEYVAGRRLVGVMGGHALQRGTAGYLGAVRLGRALAGAGLEVATGGGPGAMEAANLGGRCADVGDHDVVRLVTRLAEVAGFRPSIEAWAGGALEVAGEVPAVDTLGIPTWYYGHEPPNPFATRIAKLFANAQREDILLRVCGAGLVFLPGAGGTVQEVFQTACVNYYAAAGAAVPMVLVGREHWTRTFPVWPLLVALAEQSGFAGRVHLVEDPGEVLAHLV